MNKNKRTKDLRKQMTIAEKKLWWQLRNRQLTGYKFRRQHPVAPYYLDFACTKYSVAIEVDGGQHNENETDMKRTAYLNLKGWKLRFWNTRCWTISKAFTKRYAAFLMNVCAIKMWNKFMRVTLIRRAFAMLQRATFSLSEGEGLINHLLIHAENTSYPTHLAESRFSHNQEFYRRVCKDGSKLATRRNHRDRYGYDPIFR